MKNDNVKKTLVMKNVEGIFNEVFKKNVTISLLESIKTGGTKCIMEVTFDS